MIRFIAVLTLICSVAFTGVHVNSDPEFAKVYINGEYFGITPLYVGSLKPGKYTLRLNHIVAGTAYSNLVVKDADDIRKDIVITEPKVKPEELKHTSLDLKSIERPKESGLPYVVLVFLLVLGSRLGHINVVK